MCKHTKHLDKSSACSSHLMPCAYLYNCVTCVRAGGNVNAVRWALLRTPLGSSCSKYEGVMLMPSTKTMGKPSTRACSARGQYDHGLDVYCSMKYTAVCSVNMPQGLSHCLHCRASSNTVTIYACCLVLPLHQQLLQSGHRKGSLYLSSCRCDRYPSRGKLSPTRCSPAPRSKLQPVPPELPYRRCQRPAVPALAGPNASSQCCSA